MTGEIFCGLMFCEAIPRGLEASYVMEGVFGALGKPPKSVFQATTGFETASQREAEWRADAEVTRQTKGLA